MTTKRRREYKTGSIYQRSSDGMWVGTLEAGFTKTGARRRIPVYGKTEAVVKRKLRDKRLQIEREGLPVTGLPSSALRERLDQQDSMGSTQG